MKLLAISGSARRLSTNTALLRALEAIAPSEISLEVFDGIVNLPVFSPDLEGQATPNAVRAFKQKIANSNGIIISSPEYVRSIPGGLKNAIDWFVSGDQVIDKPIVLVHASHRGDDMLRSLRAVLSTISSNFNSELFFRLPIMAETPETIMEVVRAPANRSNAEKFLRNFALFCRTNR